MCKKNIRAHEPEAELLGPEDLEHDVAVINRCVERRQAEKRVWEALSESGTEKLMEALISAGVCKDEKEVIIRGIQTLFVAAFPESQRKHFLAP